MFNFLLAANLFFIVGYTFSALVLLFLQAFFRKRLPITPLARVSNIAIAFYALCWVLLFCFDFVQLWRKGDFETLQRSAENIKFLGYLGTTVLLAIPSLRKRAQWLLIPISLLLNLDNIAELFRDHRSGTIPSGIADTTQILWGLETREPLVLLVLGALYCLLIFLLYQLSVWVTKFAADPPQ
jgi:hypothetical protein